MTDSVSSFLASQVSYAIALPTRGGERMTILAEPLYFDGLAVLKTSLHNATEICVRCVHLIEAFAAAMK